MAADSDGLLHMGSLHRLQSVWQLPVLWQSPLPPLQSQDELYEQQHPAVWALLTSRTFALSDAHVSCSK